MNNIASLENQLWLEGFINFCKEDKNIIKLGFAYFSPYACDFTIILML